MRKSFIATLALGALVIASCQKENDYAPKAESPVFTASFDTEAPADPDTKTQLVEDANGVKKSYWVSGDAIRLLNGTNTDGCAADYTTTGEGATVSFTTTAKGYTGTQFIATYPASEANYAWWNAASDKTVNKLWLTDAQTAVEGGYDPKAHIAVAYTDTKELAFKNVVALLKISVLGTGVDKISVSAENIAGNFSYNTETGEVSKTNKDYSNRSTVTLSGTFTDGKDYYIAVLPGTYSTLTLKVNGKVFKTKAGKSTFKANSIYNMGTVNVVEEEKEIVMTIDKQNNWKNVYIYAWDYAGAKIFGEWPGTLVEGNTVTFPKSYYKADVNYILSSKIDDNNDNNMVQTLDQSQALTKDFSFTLPSEDNFFVCVNTTFTSYDKEYTATQVYAWFSDGKKITPNWPGKSLQDHTVYKYKFVDFSSPTYDLKQKYNFILNNIKEGVGQQTGDLVTGTHTVTIETTNYRF